MKFRRRQKPGLVAFWWLGTNLIKWACGSKKSEREREKKLPVILLFVIPNKNVWCISAKNYLRACWIFVIRGWNEFWDELPAAVSPLTFQRCAAFEPWIYCNLFFFPCPLLLLMRGLVINCKLASLPFDWLQCNKHTHTLSCVCRGSSFYTYGPGCLFWPGYEMSRRRLPSGTMTTDSTESGEERERKKGKCCRNCVRNLGVSRHSHIHTHTTVRKQTFRPSAPWIEQLDV